MPAPLQRHCLISVAFPATRGRSGGTDVALIRMAGTSIAAANDERLNVPDFRQEGDMRRLSLITGVSFGALIMLSCTTVSPVAVHAGDQCFRCRRPIVETAMAAELLDGNRMATKFRAPGCMAKYLAAHPDETGATVVTDYATGKWIPADRALFVPILLNRNTGESDYRAFLNPADADAAAAELHAVPVNWNGVIGKARS
jgi:hypothetical protein